MSKDTRIVHFTVVDGTEEEVQELGSALKDFKTKLNFDCEFLITNERVQLHDVKFLIAELWKLYKVQETSEKNKKLKSKLEKKAKKVSK